MVASRFYGGDKLMVGFVRRNIDSNQRADERWPKPIKSATERDMLQFCEFFAAKLCPLKRQRSDLARDQRNTGGNPGSTSPWSA
jgi:hypothetical protein